MHNGTTGNRHGALAALFAGLLYVSPAQGQLAAELEFSPGSSVDFIFLMNSFTDFGFLEDEGITSVSVDVGAANVALAPQSPPFEAIRVNTFDIATGEADLFFDFADGGILFEITISEVSISASESFEGTVDPNGNTNFPQTPVVVSGTVQIVNNNTYPMDVLVSFEEELPLDARITLQVDTLILDNIQTPPVEGEVFEKKLPAGMFGFEFELTIDTTNLELTGLSEPIALGDGDADGDVDIDDYPLYEGCFTGDGPINDPFCIVFDFQSDNDVDLIDWGGFQAAFGT